MLVRAPPKRDRNPESCPVSARAEVAGQRPRSNPRSVRQVDADSDDHRPLVRQTLQQHAGDLAPIGEKVVRPFEANLEVRSRAQRIRGGQASHKRQRGGAGRAARRHRRQKRGGEIPGLRRPRPAAPTSALSLPARGDPKRSALAARRMFPGNSIRAVDLLEGPFDRSRSAIPGRACGALSQQRRGRRVGCAGDAEPVDEWQPCQRHHQGRADQNDPILQSHAVVERLVRFIDIKDPHDAQVVESRDHARHRPGDRQRREAGVHRRPEDEQLGEESD